MAARRTWYGKVPLRVLAGTLLASTLVAGSSLTFLAVTATPAAAACTPVSSFPDTTPGEECYAIPTGTETLQITTIGGAGTGPNTGHGGSPSGQGGAGAAVTETITPPAGVSVLYLEVGSTGGGGASDYGGLGGGASDVQTCSVTTCSDTGIPATDPRLVVAAGGGGGGEDSSPTSGGTGGAGGNAGALGTSVTTPGAGGAGTQAAPSNGVAGGSAGVETSNATSPGGAESSGCSDTTNGPGRTGAPGAGGKGGDANAGSSSSGGGGGAGWVGGAGGGAGDCVFGSGDGAGGGGGAGSSYYDAALQASGTTVSVGPTGSGTEIDIVATVGTPPTFSGPTSATFTAGSPGSVTLTASGNPTPTMSETGALPAGVVFNTSTDVLSGTPTDPGTGGTYPITFTATNIAGSKTENFTLTVDEEASITSAASAEFAVSRAGTFTVTTSSTAFPTPTLSESGSLPSNVTFHDNGNGTATLSGTPPAGQQGTYPLTFTATNVAGASSQSFTLIVGLAPAITSGTSATFVYDQSGTFTVTTTGFPTASLSQSGALPSGVTFVDNGNGTGAIEGTPSNVDGGVFTITITASNGVSPNATQTFTLTVDAPPAITSPATVTFAVGTASSFTVKTSGVPDAGSMVVTDGNPVMPSGVSFVGNPDGTATISGKPAAGSGGTYDLTITASNGIAPDAQQPFQLIVTQAPAVTSADATTFTVGTSGAFTVSTGGFPGGASISLSDGGASLPSNVGFHDNGDGTATISGTPAAGTGGTYSFTITATSSAGSARQTFTLTVDQAPVLSGPTAATYTTGVAGAAVTISASGFPTPSFSEIGTLPSGVTFRDDGDGTATISGTPASGTGGVYPVVVIADNGVPYGVTETFTLTVDQPLAITSAASTTLTTGQSGTFAVTVTGYPVPTLSDGGTTLPSGVTFTDNGNGSATLAGTPADGAGGLYDFTITAHNGVSSDATQAFALTVDQAPAVTSAPGATFTVGAAGSFTVTTSGYPAPAVSESGSMPGGITFHDNGNGTATMAGTPTGTGAAFPITIAAANGVGNTATQAFVVSVDAPPALTSAASTTFQVGHAGSFTVTTTGFPVPALSDGSARLPSGVTFHDNGNGTATLSGTAAALTGGVYDFVVTASNGLSPEAQQSYVLTVLEAPTFRSAAGTTFDLGRPSTSTVSVAAYPAGSNVSISDGNAALPAGVSFRDNHNGTATLSGTPAVTSTVSFPMTLTASNGVSPAAVQRFVLTVGPTPGYTMVAEDGGAFAFGGTHYEGSLPARGISTRSIIGIVDTTDGAGYWMATSAGTVYAFGDAKPLGSLTKAPARPIVAIVGTPDDRGYWLVAGDGGVYAFGDADYEGSVPSLGVAVTNIVAMTATRDGLGYYIAGAGGVVYAFGDALFHGAGEIAHFGSAVAAIALDRATEGFWLLSKAGAIVTYHANYFGATSSAMVGIVPSQDDLGYLLVTDVGKVYGHGDAKNLGGLSGAVVPIVGVSLP